MPTRKRRRYEGRERHPFGGGLITKKTEGTGCSTQTHWELKGPTVSPRMLIVKQRGATRMYRGKKKLWGLKNRT